MKPPVALRQLRERVYEVLLASMAVSLFYGFLSLVTRDPAPMYAGLIVTAALWACVGLGSLNGRPSAEPDLPAHERL